MSEAKKPDWSGVQDKRGGKKIRECVSTTLEKFYYKRNKRNEVIASEGSGIKEGTSTTLLL